MKCTFEKSNSNIICKLEDGTIGVATRNPYVEENEEYGKSLALMRANGKFSKDFILEDNLTLENGDLFYRKDHWRLVIKNIHNNCYYSIGITSEDKNSFCSEISYDLQYTEKVIRLEDVLDCMYLYSEFISTKNLLVLNDLKTLDVIKIEKYTENNYY